MKIYIDIGHGGNDPGAVSGNLVEREMNIITGNALAERLIQYGFDVKVKPSHFDINSSANLANNFGADILLSCHYNAGGGMRGEVIHSWKNESIRLAGVVSQGLKKMGQTKVNIIKSKPNSSGSAEYFGILRSSKMPAVIIEPCFIDNIEDRRLADTVEKQKYIGVCIADAIANEYGGKLKIDTAILKTQVKLDEKKLDAYLINNRTFVELRSFCESLGRTIIWDNEAKIAIVNDNPKINIEINGVKTEGVLINNQSFGSLREIADALGKQIEWVGSTKTVIIR